MTGAKVPFRLERFNIVTDQWEIFYTYRRSAADSFLDDSSPEVYRSVGYIPNPESNWVDDYCNRGFTVAQYPNT